MILSLWKLLTPMTSVEEYGVVQASSRHHHPDVTCTEQHRGLSILKLSILYFYSILKEIKTLIMFNFFLLKTAVLPSWVPCLFAFRTFNRFLKRFNRFCWLAIGLIIVVSLLVAIDRTVNAHVISSSGSDPSLALGSFLLLPPAPKPSQIPKPPARGFFFRQNSF